MLQTLQETLSRLAALDPAVIAIAGLSLRVSFSAVGLGTLLGVPLGALVAVSQFPGRRLVVGLLNAAMGLPPVVIGLVLYLILSRSGPFGGLGLLFTPSAMIAAQTVPGCPTDRCTHAPNRGGCARSPWRATQLSWPQWSTARRDPDLRYALLAGDSASCRFRPCHIGNWRRPRRRWEHRRAYPVP